MLVLQKVMVVQEVDMEMLLIGLLLMGVTEVQLLIEKKYKLVTV